MFQCYVWNIFPLLSSSQYDGREVYCDRKWCDRLNVITLIRVYKVYMCTCHYTYALHFLPQQCPHKHIPFSHAQTQEQISPSYILLAATRFTSPTDLMLGLNISPQQDNITLSDLNSLLAHRFRQQTDSQLSVFFSHIHLHCFNNGPLRTVGIESKKNA